MVESPACPSPQLLDASKDQHVDPKDVPAWNVSPYVASILDSSVWDSLWTTIEGDVAVTLAHRELASQRQSNDQQPYATFLLNALSLLASTSASPDATDDDQAVLFDSAVHHIARGDFRGDVCTPDWVAVQVSLHELRQVVRDAMTRVEAGSELAVKALSASQGWPRILAVGLVEGVQAKRQRDYDSDDSDEEHEEEDEDKLRTILTTLKAYRPDLLSVHGCELNASGRLRVARVDAHAFAASMHNDCSEDREPTLREQLSPWLAHVLSIQRALATRDKTITPRCPSLDDDFVRYDVTLGSHTVCVTPAAASRPPGRMTWVGFEVGGDPNVLGSVCTKNCVGVVKVSYQNTQGEFKEGELLDCVHADGWLPGVVRHTFWERDEARKVGDMRLSANDTKHIVRVKETIHLGSVGDPLSQCSTPLQMLKVAYDAAETHLQLLKRGVLHRDLSWFNILCNPWHNPNTLDTKAVLTGIPCIDYILTGESNTEPYCLIADFDHAAVFSEIQKAGYQGRLERTATAMFSALEISTDKPLERVLDPFALDNVIRKLRAVEQLPVFDRAFPDSKGDFVEMLEAITELEFTRKRFLSKSADRKADNDIRQRFTDPKKILHDPCYDVQSIYWSLLWFFLRALPIGQPPLDVLDGDFSRFANSLLEHTVGDDTLRADHFFQWRGPTLELHPALRNFVPLFQNLAAYLAIPWHMYKNHPEVHVPDDHAHTAVRRLLLAEIYALTEENKGLNIALDPTQPRIINKSTSLVTYFSKQPAFCDSTTMIKRRAADAGLDEGHSSSYGKRRKVEEEEDDSNSDEKAKAPSTHPNPGRVVLGHRCYVRKCNPKSAGARAEKLRDDRYLFFGVGSRKPLQTAAAATGN